MDSSPEKKISKKKKRLEYNKKWISGKRKNLSMSHDYSSDEELSKNDIKKPDHVHASSSTTYKYQGILTKPTQNLGLEGAKTNELIIEQKNADIPCSSHSEVLNENEWDSVDQLEQILVNSDLESESDGEIICLSDELREWAIQFEIKHTALDNLLRILIKNGHEKELPSSSRTLLKTPRLVELKSISDASYYHFDTENMIRSVLKRASAENIDSLQHLVLSLNIDGLPLFKSSSTSVWPVLCCIDNLKPRKVFPISFSVGHSKPSNLNFLNDAVNDLVEISTNGIQFGERNFPVSISCIICDAPAKAFVKNVKLFSGYYGCDRCNQRGVYVGRMTYQQVYDLTLRTDRSFRNREQEEHHKGDSPLQLLPVDMVAQFPVDYMHQVCLGVMKRMLLIWMRGPRHDYRLSAAQIANISDNLVAMRKFIPNDFARKPRPLSEIDRWKATEFRQFLLYTGQFVIKGILPTKYYLHFLTLNIAISILISEKLTNDYHQYAHNLLEYFVETGKDLYGMEFMVYNVHSLIHLRNDALKFGSLENCAAWNYENYMHHLKRKVRNGNQPAVQLVKRVYEELAFEETTPFSEKKICIKEPNNWYRTKSGKFCQVLYSNNEATWMCRVYHSPEPQFNLPCDSRLIGITKFNNQSYEIKCLDNDVIEKRCMEVKQDRRLSIPATPA